MPFIQLNYGPYEANGVVKHRPQRLHGLIRSLTDKGFDVELIATQHLNRLNIDTMGLTVFRCDIRNLLFNLDGDQDVVCQRAVAVTEEAVERLYSDTNIPKFVSVKEGMRFLEKRKSWKTEDYFSSNINILYEVHDELKPSVNVDLSPTANKRDKEIDEDRKVVTLDSESVTSSNITNSSDFDAQLASSIAFLVSSSYGVQGNLAEKSIEKIKSRSQQMQVQMLSSRLAMECSKKTADKPQVTVILDTNSDCTDLGGG